MGMKPRSRPGGHRHKLGGPAVTVCRRKALEKFGDGGVHAFDRWTTVSCPECLAKRPERVCFVEIASVCVFDDEFDRDSERWTNKTHCGQSRSHNRDPPNHQNWHPI